MRSPPIVQVATLTAARQEAEALAVEGWTLVDGFGLPDMPFFLGELRLACVGQVRDEGESAAALLAAARGAAIVVAVGLPDPVDAETFADDLRGLAADGGVSAARPVEEPSPALLDRYTATLLEELARGASVAATARRLAMSLRTANRRLVDARRHYDVATNREAVVAHARATRGRP